MNVRIVTINIQNLEEDPRRQEVLRRHLERLELPDDGEWANDH